MSPKSDGFKDFIRDQLTDLHHVTCRAMFGGYGVYYHFDYVGGPRNYKWLNTNQVERTWEQMNLAWEHGVDRLWIVIFPLLYLAG